MISQEGDGKSLSNFECPGCAEKRGVPYANGKVDAEDLRERAGAAAAVIEAPPQGDEETSGGELASNTCTWPPPEAEYFFGEQRLETLACCGVHSFCAISLCCCALPQALNPGTPLLFIIFVRDAGSDSACRIRPWTITGPGASRGTSECHHARK